MPTVNQPRRVRHVFISHAGDDEWVARRMSEQIQACGATTFLAEDDIDIGADFLQRIIDELNRADELLVLLTPWSVPRPYVLMEVGTALSRGIWIIGVLYGLTPEDLQGESNIPGCGNSNLVNLNQLDHYLSQLRNRIEEDTKRWFMMFLSHPRAQIMNG